MNVRTQDSTVDTLLIMRNEAKCPIKDAAFADCINNKRLAELKSNFCPSQLAYAECTRADGPKEKGSPLKTRHLT